MVAPLAVAGVLAVVVGCSVICCCWRSSSSLSKKDSDGATLTGSIKEFFKGRGNSHQEGYLRSRNYTQDIGTERAGDL